METIPNDELLAAFLQGGHHCLCSDLECRLRIDLAAPEVLLPGAFQPVHEGHWGLAAAAERLTGCTVAFELSVINVDKPPLVSAEILRRLRQFAGRAPVWLTQAPTFADKARLFPGRTFVVGADTAERLLAARYYQHCPEKMVEAFAQIRHHHCRFLVAGREDASGRFVRLADVAVPEAYRDLFAEIPESEFRLQANSTALRSHTQKGTE